VTAPTLPNPATNPPPLVSTASTGASTGESVSSIEPRTSVSTQQLGNLVSRGSGSGDGGSVTAGNVGSGGVSISLVKAPSVGQSGIITVSLPKEMATAGSGFSFLLPVQITNQSAANAQIKVTTTTGQPLPTWLKFNAETKTFVASAVPDGAFPMQVIVIVNGQRTTVVISERAEEK